MIYTENFKKAMVQKMLIPGGPGVTRLSREIGVNKQTLYNWRDKFHDIGTGSAYTHRSPRQWTEEDKYEALLEAASLTGQIQQMRVEKEHFKKNYQIDLDEKYKDLLVDFDSKGLIENYPDHFTLTPLGLFWGYNICSAFFRNF